MKQYPMTSKLIQSVALLALAFGVTGPAYADLVQNGTFSGTIGGPSAPAFQTFFAGSTFSAGNAWTVINGPASTANSSTGSIDWIGTYWMPPAPGQHSVDLDGTPGPGGIEQTLMTTAGDYYKVTFEFSGNPDGGSNIKTLLVSAGNVVDQTYTWNVAAEGNTDSNMKWQSESFIFQATSSSTVLSFVSGDTNPGSDNGPAVADISANLTPEPSFYGILAIGVLGLFYALRRSKAVKA
jgi:choice-of-anchor C domain-containing protein